ncbi:hypothetical protein AAC387_Pa09g1207 [Persea americana]
MEWCSSRQEAQVGRERERGRKEEEQKGHGKWVQVGRRVGDGEMGYKRRYGSGGEEGMRERERKRVGERTEGWGDGERVRESGEGERVQKTRGRGGAERDRERPTREGEC